MNISDLNPNYSFSSFVAGSNNKTAYSASLAVAQSPGSKYNPLIIYGDTGLGKTHLMHSIARYILENNPKMNVLYITSEQFINEVIDTIRSGNNSALSRFHERYQNLDILLVDEIQFIVGTKAPQKEFLQILDTLHNAGKQIVISSDRPPKDMTPLEERIVSRFNQGVMVNVQSPDFENRISILQKKQEIDGCHICKDVIEYIAQNVNSNIREMQGVLNSVIALSEIEHVSPDLELARRVIKDRITKGLFDEIIVQLIPCFVAAYYHCTLAELHTSHRNGLTARSRELFIGKIVEVMLFRQFTNLYSQEIATLTGFSNGSMLVHFISDNREFIQEKCMPVFLYLYDTISEAFNLND